MSDAGQLLSNGLIRLRAPNEKDVEMFWRLVHQAEYVERWRYRGRTVSPEEFRVAFWKAVMCQFVVETDAAPRSRKPVGLVCAYDPNLRNQTVYLSLLSMPAFRGTGTMFSAAELFIEHLFRNWQLRKIYFEALEFNIPQFDGLLDLVEIEGRLKEFEYFDGRWWDLLVGTISLKQWENIRVKAHDSSKRMLLLRDPQKVMDLNAFMSLLNDLILEESLGKVGGKVTPEARLIDDLGFDSLTMLQLLDVLEGLSGTALGDEELFRVSSVRDWHNVLLTASQRPPSPMP